jgi:hypothetical protein
LTDARLEAGSTRAAINSLSEGQKMKNRNPGLVFVLACFTCGIYGLVWFVKTKEELNARGNDIPTAWLLILPFINLYWLWKWASGVEKVTGFGSAGAFILCLFLGPIGMAVVQAQLNKASAGAQAAEPTAPPAA